MPKLPTDADLGGLPSAESGRPVSSVDTTSIGSGIAAFGAGVADVGKSLETYVQREKAKQDTLEITGAQAGLNADLINANAKFQSDHDTQYSSWGQRFKADADKSLAVRAAQISDPRRRQLFIAKSQDDIARANVNVDNRARGLINSAQQTQANQQIDALTDQAFAPGVDEEQRQKILQQRDAAIDASIQSGVFTQADGLKLKKNSQLRTDKLTLQSAPPEERAAALSGPVSGKEAILDRIGGVENSTGNPAARNPNSSAMGNFQFIKSTWLDMIRRYKPDVANGRSDSEILALRADPRLSREMAGHLVDENSAKLQRAGIEPTAGNLYLAHFLGAGDAIGVLKAAPGTPVDGLVTPASISSNKSVLAGKTTDSVITWANRKMGQSGASYAAAASRLAPEERKTMYDATVRQIRETDLAAATQAANDVKQAINDLQVGLHDGTKGAADISNARREGWLNDIGDIQRSEGILQKREQGQADLSGFLTATAMPGFAWNHVDSKHKDMAEAGFKALGGDMNALESVATRTGIVPQSAATAIRGAISSNDPQRMQAAMTVATNLMSRSPTIFTGVTGADDINANAVSFQRYTQNLGMSPEDAAKRLIQEQSPEYQASVAAKIKSEDIDKLIRDKVTISDVQRLFNDSIPLIGRPTVEFAPEARQSMFQDFAELVRDNYMRHGDLARAKDEAGTQLRKLWGTTYVAGSMRGNVIRFAPEIAPAYAGIDSVGARVAEQALAVIKEQGSEADRSKIEIRPVLTGQSAKAFWAGQPVPYSLSWYDKSGKYQTLNPGKAFVPDPNQMRAAVSAARQAGLEARQAEMNPLLDRSERNQAIKRQMRQDAGDRLRATREQVEQQDDAGMGDFVARNPLPGGE